MITLQLWEGVMSPSPKNKEEDLICFITYIIIKLIKKIRGYKNGSVKKPKTKKT